MRRAAVLLLLLLSGWPVAAPAQQDRTPLTDQQKLGRRIFEQRCAVCHTLVLASGKTYGPTLSKELIAGNEDAMRDFIKNGSPGKMPGFKYGLEPQEIDAIVAYLGILPKPRPPSRPGA